MNSASSSPSEPASTASIHPRDAHCCVCQLSASHAALAASKSPDSQAVGEVSPQLGVVLVGSPLAGVRVRKNLLGIRVRASTGPQRCAEVKGSGTRTSVLSSGYAVPVSSAFTPLGLRSGLADSTAAAAPETTAADIEVPVPRM